MVCFEQRDLDMIASARQDVRLVECQRHEQFARRADEAVHQVASDLRHENFAKLEKLVQPNVMVAVIVREKVGPIRCILETKAVD